MNVSAFEEKCSRCGEVVGSSLGGALCAACCFEAAFADQPKNVPVIPSAETAPSGVRIFGPYELLEELGRGGMGVVYKARQPGLNRDIALKMLLAGEFADEASRKRLLREAQAAAGLRHPNIVTIHDVGEHDGRVFFTMEYVAGRNLAQLVQEGSLSVAKTAEYTEQLAKAVQYAHSHGIVHRDLKPANVLIDQRGEPKLTDFGLTKWLSDQSQTLLSAGSPNFMAPEQASGKHGPTGAHTDIFGLGGILYYLLTGRPPFPGEMLADTLRAVVHDDPVPPRRIRPDVPPDLETICLKCLHKQPGQRYSSAEELVDDLGRFCAVGTCSGAANQRSGEIPEMVAAQSFADSTPRDGGHRARSGDSPMEAGRSG